MKQQFGINELKFQLIVFGARARAELELTDAQPWRNGQMCEKMFRGRVPRFPKWKEKRTGGVGGRSGGVGAGILLLIVCMRRERWWRDSMADCQYEEVG